MPDLTSTPYGTVHIDGEYTATGVVFDGKGTISTISAYNDSGATIYLLFTDDIGANPPVSASAVPTFAPVPIADGGYYESTMPRGFVYGCHYCVSSTDTVYTAVADMSEIAIDIGFAR